MRFYQVHLINDEGHSAGYHWFTNEREAKSHVHHWTKDKSVEHSANIEPIDIEPTKAGILKALELYASHPDNG